MIALASIARSTFGCPSVASACVLASSRWPTNQARKLAGNATATATAANTAALAPYRTPRRGITVSLTQYQFDALVSFVYNPGGHFLPVAQAINQGDITRAMAIVKTRNTTGGKVSKGLIIRRTKEITLFEHGIYKSQAHHRHHKPH